MKRAITLVAALVAAFILAAPIAAHADVPCNNGQLCLYVDADYHGAVTIYSNPSGCVNLTGTFNNSVSSYHNFTTATHTFHMNGCSDGSHLGTAPGNSQSNLAFTGWNDEISSFN